MSGDIATLNLERVYEFRFAGIAPEKRIAVWQEIGRHVFRAAGRPEVVLDPAAGRCEFLNALPAKEKWAVDLQDVREHAAPGTKTVVGDIYDTKLPDKHFDLVWMSNFLEHLPNGDAVQGLFKVLRRVLKPGGRVVVMGPNFKYCMSEYYDCSDHLLPLTHMSLAEHLYAAGFAIESNVPRFIPFSFRSRFPAHPLLTRAYLSMPWAWPLFGKQFLVTARNPG